MLQDELEIPLNTPEGQRLLGARDVIAEDAFGAARVRVCYDPKCEELARFFLIPEASPETVSRLAGLIQKLIANFIEYEM